MLPATRRLAAGRFIAPPPNRCYACSARLLSVFAGVRLPLLGSRTGLAGGRGFGSSAARPERVDEPREEPRVECEKTEGGKGAIEEERLDREPLEVGEEDAVKRVEDDMPVGGKALGTNGGEEIARLLRRESEEERLHPDESIDSVADSGHFAPPTELLEHSDRIEEPYEEATESRPEYERLHTDESIDSVADSGHFAPPSELLEHSAVVEQRDAESSSSPPTEIIDSTPDSSHAAESSEAIPQENAVPWFLRVDTPAPPSRHPLAEKQKLPPLPDDPPPVYEPLLNQLADEYGMTEILLFDLRPLDPPPAVGTDTLMLLATARSERHLHTIGDKLCRWLRSEHKLKPIADGLVGRNELKLQNRRKRRRGKLVASQTGEIEESGRIGWVCVNVGRQEGQNIVVQLMTAERRKELDLEELWTRTLRNWRLRVAREEERRARLRAAAAADEEAERDRILRREAAERLEREEAMEREPALQRGKEGDAVDEGAEEGVVEEAVQEAVEEETVMDAAASGDAPGPTASKILGSIQQQQRSFHTDARRLTATAQPAFASSEFPPPPPPTGSAICEAISQHIETLSQHPSPLTLLGNGPRELPSTDFLRSYYSIPIPTPPTPEEFALHLDFLCIAHRRAPALYSESQIFTFLTSDTNRAYLQHEHYLRAARHLATTADSRVDRVNAVARMRALLASALPAADSSSATMPEWRYVDFLARVPQELSRIRRTALGDPEALPQAPLPGLTEWDYRVLAEFGSLQLSPEGEAGTAKKTPVPQERYTLKEHHLDHLTLLALASKWGTFRSHWKLLHLRGVPRDVDFWRLLHALVVLTRDQKAATWALRTAGLPALQKEGLRRVPRELVLLMGRVAEIAAGDDEVSAAEVMEWQHVLDAAKRVRLTEEERKRIKEREWKEGAAVVGVKGEKEAAEALAQERVPRVDGPRFKEAIERAWKEARDAQAARSQAENAQAKDAQTV